LNKLSGTSDSNWFDDLLSRRDGTLSISFASRFERFCFRGLFLDAGHDVIWTCGVMFKVAPLLFETSATLCNNEVNAAVQYR
jgi:hypothetical protein